MKKQVAYEVGRYGRKAILLDAWPGDMDPFDLAEIECNAAKGWRGANLSLLSRYPQLKAFTIIDHAIENIDAIHELHELQALNVTTECMTPIRFEAFPRLQECTLEWRPNSDSLFKCLTLKDLFVNSYNGQRSEPFGSLINLESLAILNSPIQELQGISPLTSLRALRLANLRKLKSLSGIGELSNLELLDVDSCSGFASIEEIRHLSHLRQLHLNNLGKVSSLKPLNNLQFLESVTFYESTNIVDGDLSPLAGQKNLSNISFQNRRHYSMRREDFAAAYSG